MKRTKRLLFIGATHYGDQVFIGIDAYCRIRGNWEYHIERPENSDLAPRAQAAIKEWKADGIIALVQSNRIEQFVKGTRLPTVLASTDREMNVPMVLSDSVAVGRMVARHFLESGFRNFGYCATTPALATRQRYAGFREELRKARFDCAVIEDQHFAGQSELSWIDNQRMAEQWLLSLKKPVALMCTFDSRGQQMAQACRRLGLRVPEDVAIMGVGNTEIICLSCNPRLSSVDLGIQRIGFQAARILDKMISGGRPPTKTMLIPPQRLVVRQSTDIIAVEDPDVAAAMKYIREHSAEPVSVKELLRVVPVSRRALERRFVNLVGRSPKAEIMRTHLERAKAMLADTDWPIPVVAERSGFTSREMFAVTFRRKTGLSPTEYRYRTRLGHVVHSAD